MNFCHTATRRRIVTLLISSSLIATSWAGAPARTQQPLLLVAGATGGTGTHVVEHALKRGYRVRVMTRSVERARAKFGARVEIVNADVREPETLTAALLGVTYVISSLGSSSGQDKSYAPDEVDYLGTRNLVEAAGAAGAHHFVLITAMGITQPDHPLNRSARNVLLWKSLGENSLRFSKLNYTIVRPGGLLDGPGGALLDVSQGDGFRDWHLPRGQRPAVDRMDLAAVTVEALGRKELFSRTFEVAAATDRGIVDWDQTFSGLKADLDIHITR